MYCETVKSQQRKMTIEACRNDIDQVEPEESLLLAKVNLIVTVIASIFAIRSRLFESSFETNAIPALRVCATNCKIDLQDFDCEFYQLLVVRGAQNGGTPD
jgi:hypothetical protein